MQARFTYATGDARLLLAAGLIVGLALACVPLPRPKVVPANAPAAEFSAIRALDHVRAVAQKPHPPGSEEHARVRDYIVGQLTAMGLAPQVEAGVSEFNRGRFHAKSYVENIVARLPGTASSRPVMLAAHYDSVGRGPGAGDDGHGVAVLLETLRALRAGPPLRNDVIFLITDGEEAGLLGAFLFMREHPWRHDAAVTLNFEARGTSGRSNMFETSTDNEWLIEALQAAVPHANATSVAYEIYRRMPNGTDFSVFKEGGLAGMNFAFIEHPEFYHTAQDNVQHLDRVSVQEQGRYALTLTRLFGDRDLSRHEGGDAVYFPTPFTSLIVYPADWAMPLALAELAAILAAAAAGLSRRATGSWMAAPLLIVGVAHLWTVQTAAGASYLLAWPLAAATVAYALLVSAPPKLYIGWRTSLMALCALPPFLVIVPLLPNLVVALTLRGATPVLAGAGALLLVCLLPQLALMSRGEYR